MLPGGLDLYVLGNREPGRLLSRVGYDHTGNHTCDLEGSSPPPPPSPPSPSLSSSSSSLSSSSSSSSSLSSSSLSLSSLLSSSSSSSSCQSPDLQVPLHIIYTFGVD